jgi:hypothetical protein
MTPPDLTRLVARHAMIADIRLDGLEDAIRARDWEQVEWHYDRVDRAIAKLIRLTDTHNTGGPHE